MTRNPSLSRIRIVAVVKESLVNADGSCEVDLFREYLPRGEVYVDETRGFYKALGARSIFSFFSKEGLTYFKQRAEGVRKQRIEGNLNGASADPLLLGGVILVAPSGEVVWVHQEGRGPLFYDELESVLKELASSVSVSPEKEGDSEEETQSWLEGVIDGLLSMFK